MVQRRPEEAKYAGSKSASDTKLCEGTMKIQIECPRCYNKIIFTEQDKGSITLGASIFCDKCREWFGLRKITEITEEK